MKVKCPRCKKEIEYSDKNPYRPFCSKRCWLIDLGAWLKEEYVIEEKENQQKDETKESQS